jgi:hypothetical protein
VIALISTSIASLQYSRSRPSAERSRSIEKPFEVVGQLAGELGRLRGHGGQQQQQHQHQGDEERPGDHEGRGGPAQVPALQPVGRRIQEIGGGHADQERQQDVAKQVQADQERQERDQPDQGEPDALAQEVRSGPIERTAWAA